MIKNEELFNNNAKIYKCDVEIKITDDNGIEYVESISGEYENDDGETNVLEIATNALTAYQEYLEKRIEESKSKQIINDILKKHKRN